MKELTLTKMMELQLQLWEKNKDNWNPMEPKYGKNSLLWLFEELGEVVAIVKKQGEDKIMNEQVVRDHFVEEMSDVLMYYLDVLLRFGVTPEELSKIFLEKSLKNLDRDYHKEYSTQYAKRD